MQEVSQKPSKKMNFTTLKKKHDSLTLSWRRPISYRNQSFDLLRKSMNWFLYDIGLPHERFNQKKGKKS